MEQDARQREVREGEMGLQLHNEFAEAMPWPPKAKVTSLNRVRCARFFNGLVSSAGETAGY